MNTKSEIKRLLSLGAPVIVDHDHPLFHWLLESVHQGNLVFEFVGEDKRSMSFRMATGSDPPLCSVCRHRHGPETVHPCE